MFLHSYPSTLAYYLAHLIDVRFQCVMPMFSKLILIFVSVLIIFSVNAFAYAKVIESASGSRDHLQAAVNTASIGDTVQIPAGNFSFKGSVVIPAGITIVGAGENETILTKLGSFEQPMITIDCSNGEKAFVSDMTLVGLGDESTKDKGIELIDNCKDFRIFNASFKKFGHAGVRIRGNTRGLVDHCTFIDNYRPSLGYGVTVIGDGTWPELELGTENAVFMEDNYFEGSRHAIASNNGSRYVFRHNVIVNNRENAAAIDAHGLSSWPRGSRSFEIYGNSIDNAIRRFAGVGIRGGDGVIFNNTITAGSTTNPILLHNDGGNGCAYPCKDQIRELYIWDNAYGDQPAKVVLYYDSYSNIIKRDRDYFLFKRPGYTPYVYPHPLVGNAPKIGAPKNLRIRP